MFDSIQIGAPGASLFGVAGPPNGDALIFLHGVTRRWNDFSPLFGALSPRWQIFSIDLRGHGASSWVPGNYRVTDYISDVAHWVRTFEKPVVIYGHSLGAMVAAAAAADAPENVRALILEDPPFETMGAKIVESPLGAQFRGMREVMKNLGPNVQEIAERIGAIEIPRAGGGVVRMRDLRDPTSIRFSARCLQFMDPAVLDPICEGRWLEGYDAPAIRERVTCPALLLQADAGMGGMLTDADAASWRSEVKRCECVKVSGVGHLIHWMATETVVRLATGFLESL